MRKATDFFKLTYQLGNLNLTAKEIIAFIPSGKNYEKAIQFYLEIGRC